MLAFLLPVKTCQSKLAVFVTDAKQDLVLTIQ